MNSSFELHSTAGQSPLLSGLQNSIQVNQQRKHIFRNKMEYYANS